VKMAGPASSRRGPSAPRTPASSRRRSRPTSRRWTSANARPRSRRRRPGPTRRRPRRRSRRAGHRRPGAAHPEARPDGRPWPRRRGAGRRRGPGVRGAGQRGGRGHHGQGRRARPRDDRVAQRRRAVEDRALDRAAWDRASRAPGRRWSSRTRATRTRPARSRPRRLDEAQAAKNAAEAAAARVRKDAETRAELSALRGDMARDAGLRRAGPRPRGGVPLVRHRSRDGRGRGGRHDQGLRDRRDPRGGPGRLGAPAGRRPQRRRLGRGGCSSWRTPCPPNPSRSACGARCARATPRRSGARGRDRRGALPPGAIYALADALLLRGEAGRALSLLRASNAAAPGDPW